jgi:hypothetical protein
MRLIWSMRLMWPNGWLVDGSRLIRLMRLMWPNG